MKRRITDFREFMGLPEPKPKKPPRKKWGFSDMKVGEVKHVPAADATLAILAYRQIENYWGKSSIRFEHKRKHNGDLMVRRKS